MKPDKHEERHVLNLKRYANEIVKQYGKAIDAITQEIAYLPFKEGEPFYFSDYPYIKSKIDQILRGLQRKTTATILSGVRMEAELADHYVNGTSEDFFAKAEKRGLLTDEQKKELIRQYTYTSVDAALKFVERKVNGLGLSKRVWSFTRMLKEDVELALETGIKQGTSAAELSRTIRNALKEPNMLFRSVRKPDGTYGLSKAAKAYHPGQGVYRSSYKNALRLTATETNIAYRSSVAEGFKTLDFHRGWAIYLSNNHTCKNPKTGKPEPFFDICDEVHSTQGYESTYYPWDWVHIGWHPNCRCFAVPVLQDVSSFMFNVLAKLNGTGERKDANRITSTPRQLEEWKAKHLDTYMGYKTTPYFISVNRKYFAA